MRDIEFDQHRIKVDHQLQRTSDMQYIVQEPKTESGIRYVPMTPEVEDCFRRIIVKRESPKCEPMVDGHVGFLCLDKNEQPMVALHWEKYMAKSRMKPKTLPYIMGHSDISATLNTYTHVQFEDVQDELLRVSNG